MFSHLIRHASVLAAGLSLSLLGCGGPQKTETDLGTGDLAFSGDLAVSVADLAGACNALSYASAPVVAVEANPGEAPAFTGGTVADGTYYLTSETFYGLSVDGGSLGADQLVLVVKSGTIDVDSMQLGQFSATYTTTGTELDLVDTCPDTDSAMFQYSASGSTFSFGQPGGSSTSVLVFAKQ